MRVHAHHVTYVKEKAILLLIMLLPWWDVGSFLFSCLHQILCCAKSLVPAISSGSVSTLQEATPPTSLPLSLRNRLEVSQHSTPGLERESPKNEDVLLHNHKTVLRIQHFHLIFGPLSNFPSDPNNNRRCGFCGSGPNRGSPREYSCLYKLQRASPKNKDICLRNHNTMVTFGKLKTGSVLLSDGLSSPACPPSHL